MHVRGRRPVVVVVALAVCALLAGCTASGSASDAPARAAAEGIKLPGAATERVTMQRIARPRAVAPATSSSWNTNVFCQASITTLAQVLGNQRNAAGGATYAGGQYRPGIPDRRSVNPPCSVNGVPTLVQLNDVTVGSCAKINLDNDWTCKLRDPNAPASTPTSMKAIHIEMDGQYRQRGWAPSVPPGNTRIDVQGFVFWDPGHENAKWHEYSGWELHSFTAWRRHQ